MDSKLFFGTHVGSLDKIIPILQQYYPSSLSGWEYVEWVNTKLPKKIYMDLWYPSMDADPSHVEVHLNLLDSRDSYSIRRIQRIIKRSDYVMYAFLLGLFRVPYVNPCFYTKHYNYD